MSIASFNTFSKRIYTDFLLSYLAIDDINEFICVNRFVYDLIALESRIFSLYGRTVPFLLENENYRQYVCSRIVDAGKQIIIVVERMPLSVTSMVKEDALNELKESSSIFNQLTTPIEAAFPFSSLRSLEISYGGFLYLCEGLRDSFSVERLELFGFDELQVIEKWLRPHLTKAAKHLNLANWTVEIVPPLASTLEALDLNECLDLTLPPLPSLKRLLTSATKVLNLADLPPLQELVMSGMSSLDLKQLPPCKKLRLACCEEVVNLEALLDIEQIILDNTLLDDFLLPFRQTKVLELAYISSGSCMNLDLSQCPNLTQFTWEGCSCDLSGPLVSDEDAPPSNLRKVILQDFPAPLNMQWFAHVSYIKLIACHQVTSLIGLESVSTVLLHYISELTTLDGLGKGNVNVEITSCPNVSDFSALRNVPNVVIGNCENFTDASDLADAQTVRIYSCNRLRDISCLHKVNNLTIHDCHHVYDHGGLENIRRLTIFQCRNLKSPPALFSGATPIYARDFGQRVASDRLSRLPDSLYHVIFSYLSPETVLDCVSVNCYLYQRLIKVVRHISLKQELELEDFFVYPLCRDQILSRMEDPSKQLTISFAESFSFFSAVDRGSISLPNGIHHLVAMREAFEFLVERVPALIQKISFLHLIQYGGNASEDEVIWKEVASRVTKSMKLERIHLPDVIQLPDTLETLTLYSSICGKIIPNRGLTSLIISDTKIREWSDFNHLQRVELLRVQSPDLTAISSVRFVLLSDCPGIVSYETLQENEKVVIENYDISIKVDFRKCFRHAKKIVLTFNRAWIDLDLSYYERLEILEIHGSDIQLSSPSLPYEKHVPASLSMLKLAGISSLKNLQPGFEHLKELHIVNCNKFSSVEGLGNVKTLVLKDLVSLKSLQGLGPGNQSVRLTGINNVMDFSPVGMVDDLYIEDCSGLVDASQIARVKRRIVLSFLFELSDIKALVNVPCLELHYCSGIKPFDELKDMPRLFVYGCGELNDYCRRTESVVRNAVLPSGF